MKYRNPFKPTAGKMPPVLVGRDKVINDFIEGLENGEGAPGLLMRITGYLSPYRRQLIARQIIEQTAPGYVTFSIPFMGEFLAERRGEILARYGG